MDSEKVNVELKIIECLNNKKNFLLSGGAGSGKTYTLMQVLDYIFKNETNPSVACITYTNVAADEIKRRTPYSNLRVSTIHDFLWDMIKFYQKNIKEAMINNAIDLKGEINETDINNFKEIKYREYKKLSEGIVSHDEVLKISNYLFKNYPLISKIVADKFHYIFIDEYQDTQENVIKLFLDYFYENCNHKTVLGFFGDKVQSIYNSGIGNINNYVDNNKVVEIVKQDNYRCSTSVIGLLNKIRKDGILQEPTGSNKEVTGSAKFLYSKNDNFKISEIQENTIFEKWNFSDEKNNKVLCLTHRLVSKEYQFDDLFNLFYEKYSSNTPNVLFGEDNDKSIKFFYKINELILLYENKKHNELIKNIDRKIDKLEDKKTVKECLEKIISKSKTDNISIVLDYALKEKLLVLDDSIKEYINDNKEFYEKLIKLKFEQIKKLYNYDKGYSVFSTQHGVKGAEYKNVFVLLDNGNWSQYNFTKIFDDYNHNGEKGNANATQKLFYVCCSRAKENLVVYYNKPSLELINNAKLIFGIENVIEI